MTPQPGSDYAAGPLMTKQTKQIRPERSRTGIPGLDQVLGGGFIPNRLYLIDGDPGAGKTTLSAPVPS